MVSAGSSAPTQTNENNTFFFVLFVYFVVKYFPNFSKSGLALNLL